MPMAFYKPEVFIKSHIDICLVSEAHMIAQSYTKLKGYKIYYTIHSDNQAKGGSAVRIKDSISHYEEQHIQSTKSNLL